MLAAPFRGLRGRRYPGCPHGTLPRTAGTARPVRVLLPAGAARARRHLRRRHGHEPAAARAWAPTTSAGPSSRAATRSWSRRRPDARRAGAPLLLRGRVRRRRDRHLRVDFGGAGRVRPGRPGPRADPHGRRARLRGARRVRHARPPPLGGRHHGPGDQVPHARPDPLRRLPRRLRGAGARAARGRRRPAPDRDAVRPAVGEGGHQRRPPGHGGARPHRAAAGPGDDRADRPHAAGHRDRRRADRPRRHAGRRGRPQLRHRARSR